MGGKKAKTEGHSVGKDHRCLPVRCFPSMSGNHLGLNPDSVTYKLHDLEEVINSSVPQLPRCEIRIKISVVNIISINLNIELRIPSTQKP